LVEEIRSAGGQALAIQADSADPEAINRAVAEAASAFGRIDILVNNAGILIRNTVDGFDLADFERMFAVNVKSVFVGVQAVLPHMGEGGRIITTGSVVADRSGFPGTSVYSMTKGAVAAMTRGLARDLGRRGITVNAIQPGPTETDMNPDEGVKAMVRPLIPVGRMGKDSEIASLVAYLAGPDAAFVNGAALTIDGGYLA
jgi:3-oxoacyl-[acyl-carrier protein] reductase